MQEGLDTITNLWNQLPSIIKWNIYIFGSGLLFGIFLDIIVKPIGLLIIYITCQIEYLKDIKELNKEKNIHKN